MSVFRWVLKVGLFRHSISCFVSLLYKMFVLQYRLPSAVILTCDHLLTMLSEWFESFPYLESLLISFVCIRFPTFLTCLFYDCLNETCNKQTSSWWTWICCTTTLPDPERLPCPCVMGHLTAHTTCESSLHLLECIDITFSLNVLLCNLLAKIQNSGSHISAWTATVS